MPRRFQHSARLLAIVTVVAAMSTVGCRQLGRRAAAPEPSPVLPSAPQFSPPQNVEPTLQDIPPLPPAAAKRSKIGGFSLPAAAASSEAEPSDTLIIAPVAGESEPADELSSLIPPAADRGYEAELVPAPRDIEDEPVALERMPELSDEPVVELDVAEFLAELEQTPAPVKALTIATDGESVPQPIARAIASPVAAEQNESGIEPWPPQGFPHGIAISPGPTGTGNRLEMHAYPVWNHGRIAPAPLPTWGSTNSWAGPNSDGDGRRFR